MRGGWRFGVYQRSVPQARKKYVSNVSCFTTRLLRAEIQPPCLLGPGTTLCSRQTTTACDHNTFTSICGTQSTVASRRRDVFCISCELLQAAFLVRTRGHEFPVLFTVQSVVFRLYHWLRGRCAPMMLEWLEPEAGLYASFMIVSLLWPTTEGNLPSPSLSWWSTRPLPEFPRS